MKIIADTYKKEVYFCPYCKAFSSYPKNFISEEKKRNSPYKCYKCKRYFNHKTYIEEKNNKKRHHCDCTSKKVEDKIEELIIDLYNKGHSHRRIQDITKFSRTKIQHITSSKKDVKHISKKEFLKNNLKIDEYTLLDEAINIALDYGCSVRTTRKLFSTSYKTINRSSVLAEYHNNSKYKRRVKIEGDKVILSYF